MKTKTNKSHSKLYWIRDLRETGCEDVIEIHLTHGRIQWKFLVNMVKNLQVSQKAGHFLT